MSAKPQASSVAAVENDSNLESTKALHTMSRAGTIADEPRIIHSGGDPPRQHKSLGADKGKCFECSSYEMGDAEDLSSYGLPLSEQDDPEDEKGNEAVDDQRNDMYDFEKCVEDASDYEYSDEEDSSIYELCPSQPDETENDNDGGRSHDMGYFDGLMIDPLSVDMSGPFEQLSSAGTVAASPPGSTSVAEFNQVLTGNYRKNDLATIHKDNYWMTHLATVNKRDVEDMSFLPPILQSFRSYLESDSFLPACQRAGLVDPEFTWKQPSQVVCNNFLGANLPATETHHITLGLTFHGTATANIESILRDGLDPKRRNGQAYGEGEYFGKEPGVSLYYCKGGCRMLVFCVVAVDPDRQLPPGYVVVKESSYQLPLGILSFSSASQSAMSRSNQLQIQLQTLAKEAQERDTLAQEARLKSTVEQFIIQGELELAANSFKKASEKFSEESKIEIACYAYRQRLWDEEFVNYYFGPKLPARSVCNWESVQDKIKSVEDQEKEADEAWGKVDEKMKSMDNYTT